MPRGQGPGTGLPSSFIPDEPVSLPPSFIEDTATTIPTRARGAGPGTQTQVPPRKLTPEEEFALQLNESPNLDLMAPITQAPKFITDRAKKIADYLTTPVTRPNELTSEALAAGGVMHPNAPKVKTEASPLAAFTGGAIEGAAEMASPLNVGLAASGMGEVVAVNRARKLAEVGRLAEANRAARVALGLEGLTRAASVPQAMNAAGKIADPESTMMERITGVPELAGALLGTRARVRRSFDDVKVPDLTEPIIAPESTDIPMRATDRGFEAADRVNLNVPAVRPKQNIGAITVKPSPQSPALIGKLVSQGYRIDQVSETGVRMLPPAETPVTPGPQSVTNDLTTPIPQDPLANELIQQEGPLSDEQILFQKVKGGVDEKTAIIEDEGEMWDLGEEGKFYSVGIPTAMGDGTFALSHGILDEATKARLEAEGIKLVKRSEIGQQTSDFGIPQDRMFAADKEVMNNEGRMQELANKFADMTTAKTFPETGESTYKTALEKLGGRQVVKDDEGIQLSRNFDDDNDKIITFEDPSKHAAQTREIIAEMRKEAETDPRIAKILDDYDPDTFYAEIRRRKMLRNLPVDENTPLMSRTDRPVDEVGNPLDVAEWTPEALAARKKDIATAWYEARKRATELGIDHKKFRKMEDLRAAIKSAEGPQLAKVDEDTLAIGSDVKRSAKELTTGYSHPLPGIMVREALQNAMDAVKKIHSGSSGKVGITVDNDGITVTDNGSGMTKEELFTVFSDLHSSGKTNEKGATGGKGVGKASYMLGGNFFTLETVTNQNGQKVKLSFSGTPEQLLTGAKIKTEIVDPKTPTGTTVKTQFSSEQIAENDTMYARNMVDKILDYSRGIPIELHVNNRGYQHPIKQIKSFKNDKLIADVSIGNSNVQVYLPEGTNKKSFKSRYLDMQILNNGMYQYEKSIPLDDETHNLPEHIIVNFEPQVEEGDVNYPFPVQRESLKKGLDDQLEKIVKAAVVEPLVRRQKNDLMMFWNDLPKFPGLDTIRQTLMFDSGSRMTDTEIEMFQNSPVIHEIIKAFDYIIEEVLETSQLNQDSDLQQLFDRLNPDYAEPGKGGSKEIRPNDVDWSDKVKYVGLIFDPSINGIHIPHPLTKGSVSAILVNPFNISNRTKPEQAAIDIMVTVLHEAAHVGKTAPSNKDKAPTINETELDDPRLGAYLSTYLKEVHEQGGLDLGHGIDFVRRLGEIYAKVGTRGLDLSNTIRDAISEYDSLDGVWRYRPEFQKLLRVYNESRRRAETKADILSRTGVKSTVKGSGARPLPSNTGPNGVGVSRTVNRIALKGATTKQLRKDALNAGFTPTGYSDKDGNPIWERQEDQELNLFNEIWNLPRGMMSVDLPFVTSAAMRQGIPLIGPNFKGWLKGWVNSARAYSSKQAAAQVTQELSKSELLRRGRDAENKETPSYAEKVGLELTDTTNMLRREEAIKSKWAEKIPLWGRHVAASNRAFTAFLNTLRVSSLERFVAQAGEDSLMYRLSGGKFGREGQDAKTDLELGRNIADAINTLSGRGKLEAEFTPNTRFTKQRKYSVEGAAKYLVDIFFSPRLLASRIKMLNPNTYISADPFTRKLYIKGMLSAIGTWWAISSLIEMAGGEVNKDPNNADFGKGRIGNTRIDPGAGFQQFLVLGSRLRPNQFRIPFPVPTPPYGELMEDPGGDIFTSSTSGESRRLGTGFRPITDAGLLAEFTRSKLHPTAGLIYDLLDKQEDKPVYLGDRLIQMVTPMMAGDLSEVIQEDPTLLPLVIGAGSIGLGAGTYEGGKRKPTMTPLIEQLTGIPATEYDLELR